MAGDNYPNTLNSINNLELRLLAEGKHADAAQLLAPAEPACRPALTGANAWKLAVFLIHLGKARTGLGEFPAAEWHAAEPGKGYDAKAAEWRAKLELIQPTAADLEPPEKK